MFQSELFGPLAAQKDRWPCALRDCVPRADQCRARRNFPSSKRELSDLGPPSIFLHLRAAPQEKVCADLLPAESTARSYRPLSARGGSPVPPAKTSSERLQVPE